MWKALALLASVLVAFTYADIYLQHPPGSNNRLNRNRRNRKNAKRLFNSQNNARGGYNEQSVDHYAGSDMYIEWTNQHQCGGKNTNCDIIIQYMCDDDIRNGKTEKTIKFKQSYDENENYGRHESFKYYFRCATRERNKGLFIADQEMKFNTAQSTRQDGDGTRYAYECPEERDYYPYWGPTPWKDIVIMTGDKSRCKEFIANSQNQNAKYHCVPDPADIDSLPDNPNRLKNKFRKNPVPITQEGCESYTEKFKVTKAKTTSTWKWTKVDKHDVPDPECIDAPYSRDNHNGNGVGGEPLSYTWHIPSNLQADKCVLRIRYNISTGEFPYDTDSKSNNQNDALNLGSLVGLSATDAKKRGYTLTGNPDVTLLEDGDFKLKLAVNTNQFGRTFQDRTHAFAIKKRPDNVPASAKIHTLSVRGKRGNIVQTYPATEYDFAPNEIRMNENDYIYVSLGGSDTNPRNNDGQGAKGTDRHNIILLEDAKYPFAKKADKPDKYGHWANSYPKNLTTGTFLGLSKDDALDLADAHKLKTFTMEPRKVTKVGTYRYVCTRNNAFTNRGQKAVVYVEESEQDQRLLSVIEDEW